MAQTGQPGHAAANFLSQLFSRNGQLGNRLQFRALHPHNPALPLDHRPLGAIRSGDFEAFQDFLDLARAAGIAKSDPVAWFPVPDGCWSVRLHSLGKKAPTKGNRLARHRKLNLLALLRWLTE